MAGYFNYSMSNNAIASYENGEKPFSRWTKSAFLDAITGMILNGDLPESIADDLKGFTLSDYQQFLTSCGWHHTSCKYNRTTFYRLDEDAILHHFNYVSVVKGSLSDGTTVYGNFCGDRDPVSMKLSSFKTVDGIVYPAADILNRTIDYIKKADR